MDRSPFSEVLKFHGKERRTNMIYKGPSMAPLFRDLDFLEILPYNRQRIAAGDVVVVVAPDTGTKIVHRVISKVKGVIRTKGDNNRLLDSFLLDEKDILGKVVAVTRGTRRRLVWNGAKGLFVHLLWQAWLILFDFGGTRLRPAWRALEYIRPFRWLSNLLPDLQVVCFTRPEGHEYQAFLGRFHVANLPASGHGWVMNRWARLIFNPAHIHGKVCGDQ